MHSFEIINISWIPGCIACWICLSIGRVGREQVEVAGDNLLHGARCYFILELLRGEHVIVTVQQSLTQQYADPWSVPSQASDSQSHVSIFEGYNIEKINYDAPNHSGKGILFSYNDNS